LEQENARFFAPKDGAQNDKMQNSNVGDNKPQ